MLLLIYSQLDHNIGIKPSIIRYVTCNRLLYLFSVGCPSDLCGGGKVWLWKVNKQTCLVLRRWVNSADEWLNRTSYLWEISAGLFHEVSSTCFTSQSC